MEQKYQFIKQQQSTIKRPESASKQDKPIQQTIQKPETMRVGTSDNMIQYQNQLKRERENVWPNSTNQITALRNLHTMEAQKPQGDNRY